jgi:hypothetical protein
MKWQNWHKYWHTGLIVAVSAFVVLFLAGWSLRVFASTPSNQASQIAEAAGPHRVIYYYQTLKDLSPIINKQI